MFQLATEPLACRHFTSLISRDYRSQFDGIAIAAPALRDIRNQG